jgi:hypothetical protein
VIADPNAVHDSIPFYPGAILDGAPALPPGLGRAEDADDFQYDRRYFSEGGSASQQSVLNYFAEELPNEGWEVEDPVESDVAEIDALCPDMSIADATAGTPIGLIHCAGYTKDDVRMVLIVAFPLGLNPSSPQGISYHVHLEAK